MFSGDGHVMTDSPATTGPAGPRARGWPRRRRRRGGVRRGDRASRQTFRRGRRRVPRLQRGWRLRVRCVFTTPNINSTPLWYLDQTSARRASRGRRGPAGEECFAAVQPLLLCTAFVSDPMVSAVILPACATSPAAANFAAGSVPVDQACTAEVRRGASASPLVPLPLLRCPLLRYRYRPPWVTLRPKK
jgi:hypothetical protein